MDIKVLEKIKSRKLAAFVLAGAQLVRMEAPWEAFVYLAIGYFVAEAIQMSVEKIAGKQVP